MEFVKCYRQDMPATRFIGKQYGEADRVNGTFGAKWDEAFQTGLFEAIEAAEGDRQPEYFEDSGAYIGLMGYDDEAFTYWIGKLTRPGTSVPDGFDFLDFPAEQVGVGWLHGMENELYGHEDVVLRELAKLNLAPNRDENGLRWCFERYQCPRFTKPDKNGAVTLDVCFFVE